MRLGQLFILFISVFLLTACVPKFNKQTMIENKTISQELKQDINSSRYSKSGLSLKWWQAYGDKQLDAMLEKVLKDAPKLKVLQARYAHANNVISSVRSNNLPQISLGGGIARERFSANYIFPPPLGGGTVSLYELHTQLNYEFDFWDKRKSQILAAKYGAMSQKVYIDEMKLLLSSAICRFYLSWNYEDKSLEMLDALKKVLLQKKRIFTLQKNNGLVSATALYNIDAQLSVVNQQIQGHKRVIEGLKQSIAILGGFYPSYMHTLREPKISQAFKMPLPKTVYLDLLSHRPDIIVQKYIVLAQNERIHEAKARFYPNINLAALIGFTSFDSAKFMDYSSFAPMAGAAFSLPLFDNGARKANLFMNVNEYDSAVNAYNGLVIQAANETVTILRKQTMMQSQMQAVDAELKSRQKNYEITLNRFHAGVTNMLPALEMKEQLLHNELVRISLANQSALLEINLIKALGGGYTQEEQYAAK